MEKLQTISTKYRKQQEEGSFPINFMRHYYDAYCLLAVQDVKEFIGTQDYYDHKMRRFPKSDNQNLSKNEAFILSDLATFDRYADAYKSSESLYYRKQPPFQELIERLRLAIRDGKL